MADKPGRALRDTGLFIVIVIAFFAACGCPSVTGWVLLARQAAMYLPAIAGMLIMLTLEEYYVAAGAHMTLIATLLGALLARTGIHVFPAVCVVLAVSGLAGAGTSMICRRTGMPLYVVSLATFMIMSGLCGTLYLYHSTPVYRYAGTDKAAVLGIPVWVLCLIAALLLVTFFLDRTTYGRIAVLYAKNKAVIRTSGIPVHVVRGAVMTVGSVLIGISAILLAFRSGTTARYDSISYGAKLLSALGIAGLRPVNGKTVLYRLLAGSLGIVLLTALEQHFHLTENFSYCSSAVVFISAVIIRRTTGE